MQMFVLNNSKVFGISVIDEIMQRSPLGAIASSLTLMAVGWKWSKAAFTAMTLKRRNRLGSLNILSSEWSSVSRCLGVHCDNN